MSTALNGLYLLYIHIIDVFTLLLDDIDSEDIDAQYDISCHSKRTDFLDTRQNRAPVGRGGSKHTRGRLRILTF
jgi:hypothetical protein